MQNLYRLANVMGLDTASPQHTVALKEAMFTIIDPNEFIEYCRNEKNGIQFVTKTERLDILATRYKTTKNAIPTMALRKFSNSLYEKFKTAIQSLRDNEEYLSMDLSKLRVEGASYFDNREIEVLEQVGMLNSLINRYELNTLSDDIYEVSIKKTLLVAKNKSLSNSTKAIK